MQISILVLRFGSPSFLTRVHLRTERHALHNYLCLKFILQRLNYIIRVLIPCNFLVFAILSIYANCLAATLKAKSPLLATIRKANYTTYSLLVIVYIEQVCGLAGKVLSYSSKGLKRWRLGSKQAYYKKSFKAIPPMQLKAGSFFKINKFTSMKILVQIIKYTGKMLINMMKEK